MQFAPGTEADVPLPGSLSIVKHASTAADLAAEVARAVAAVIADSATAVLYDFMVQGGGAGNVFEAVLLIQPTNDVAPPLNGFLLSQMTFKWFQASDAKTMQDKINAYLDSLVPAIVGIGPLPAFWAHACSGDGATWLTALVTWVNLDV